METKRSNSTLSSRVPVEECVELYKNGWPIADISANYNIYPLAIRKILQRKGYVTHKYRSTPLFWKKCIYELLSTEKKMRYISELTDISTHLMRQLLRDEQINVEDLKKAQHEKAAKSNTNDVTLEPSIRDAFLELYRSGKFGFMKCLKECNLDFSCCRELDKHIRNEDIAEHRANLCGVVRSMFGSGISVAIIAKQLNMSPSVVKQMLKDD